MFNKKGQAGGIVGIIIALVFGIIGIVIIADVITSGNFTGITATVVDYIPVFLGLSMLALAAMVGFGRMLR